MKSSNPVRKLSSLLVLGTVLAGSFGSAAAASFSEVEGNGTFASANSVWSGTHSLSGSINPSQDVDIYRFGNLFAGSSFSASVASKTTTPGLAFDISMVLFDSTGHAWWGNDGWNGAINFSVTNADTYYLAVSAYQNEALDEFGNMLRVDSWWTSDPMFPGTSFAGWSNGGFGSGNYTLNVSSVGTVPVPAAAWLLGSGLIGLVAAGRRRKQMV